MALLRGRVTPKTWTIPPRRRQDTVFGGTLLSAAPLAGRTALCRTASLQTASYRNCRAQPSLPPLLTMQNHFFYLLRPAWLGKVNLRPAAYSCLPLDPAHTPRTSTRPKFPSRSPPCVDQASKILGRTTSKCAEQSTKTKAATNWV